MLGVSTIAHVTITVYWARYWVPLGGITGALLCNSRLLAPAEFVGLVFSAQLNHGHAEGRATKGCVEAPVRDGDHDLPASHLGGDGKQLLDVIQRRTDGGPKALNSGCRSPARP